MGFDFENFMVRVRTDVTEAISQQYSHYPDLSSLATIILTNSITFITNIIYWVDYTHNIIVDGGNTYYNVWVFITQVIQSFFEEVIDPYMSTTIGTNFRSQIEQTSFIFWGVFITNIATDKLLDGQMKDDTIVTRSYDKWLVNHSGRKYVLDTQVAAENWRRRLKP